MKFIISVVNKDDARPLVDVLVTNGYRVTTLKSAGGFLRKENVTLFTGVEDDEQVEDVVRLIQDNCHTRIGKGLARYSHPGIVGTLTPIML